MCQHAADGCCNQQHALDIPVSPILIDVAAAATTINITYVK